MAQLAVLAVPFVGQALGAAAGGALGFAGLGSALGGFGGAWLANRLFGPGSQVQEGPRISDKKVLTADYGTAIPWVHGAMRVSGNIIWANKIVEKRQTETKNGVKTRTYYYFGQFAVAFCKGPVQHVRRIWADDKLVLDLSDDSNKKATRRFRKAPRGVDVKVATRIYLGDEEQEPDPLIESVEGAGNVPAFRGLCYVVFENLPLRAFGNRIPQISAEIVQSGSEPTTVTLHTPNFSSLHRDVATAGEDRAANEDGTVVYFSGSSGGRHYVMAVDLRSMRPLWTTLVGADNATMAAWFRRITSTWSLPNLLLTNVAYSPYTRNLYLCANSSTYVTWVVELRADTGEPVRLWHVPTNNGTDCFAFDKYLIVGLWDTIGTESLIVYDLSRWPNPNSPTAAPTKVAAVPSSVVDDIRQDAIVATKDYVVAYDRDLDRFVRLSRADWSYTTHDVVPIIGYDPGLSVTLLYDQDSDRVIMVTYGGSPVRTRIHRINPATMTVEKSYVGTGDATTTFPNGFYELGRVVRNGQFWIAAQSGSSEYRLIDVASMRAVRTRSWSSWPSNTNGPRFFNQETGAFVTLTTSYVASLNQEQISINQQQLSALVQALCLETKLVSGDLDTSELTDLYWGFMVSQPSSVRSVLEMLSDPFMFDIVESDGKLKFRKRDKASALTLNWNELGVRSDSAGGREDVLVETRAQELELPRRIVVTCVNPRQKYNTLSYQAQRYQQLVSPVDEEVIELPMALSASVASKIPQLMLGAAWVERIRFSFSLSTARAALEPGDVITIDKVGEVSSSHRVRITQTTFTSNWTIECEALSTDSVYYNNSAVPDSDVVSTPTDDSDSIPFDSPSRLFLMNLPCRSSSDDGFFGFHLAAGPVDAASDSSWAGCDVARSSDNVSYDLYTSILAPVSHAIADTVLPGVVNWASWDTTSTLDITVLSSTWVPTSSTDLAVLNGANRILVGEEIVAFVNVTALGGNRYRLSRLLRGMHSTDFAVFNHRPYERVVDLSDSDILKVGDGSERGLDFWYSCSSHNYEGVEEAPVKFRSTAACLMPYSPAIVSRSRTGTGLSAQATVTWVRRTRFNGGLVDGTGTVPLNEIEELYELDLFDPQGRLLRTVSQSSTSYTYNLSNYLSDAGIASAEFTWSPSELGFETGTLGSWTVQAGSWFVSATTDIVPRAGSYFVFSTASGSVLRLTVDVTTLVPLEQVDTGSGTLAFTVWQSRFSGSATGFNRLILLDGGSNTLATYTSSASSFASWTQRTASGTLLAGTRWLLLELVGGDRVLFDDARLTVSGLAPTITFDIYQISRTVGRGFVRRTTA